MKRYCYTVHPVACIVCLEPIAKSTRRIRYYCSTACTNAKRRVPHSLWVARCDECGTGFQTCQGHARFCSWPCKSRAATRRRRAERLRWRMYDRPAGPPEPELDTHLRSLGPPAPRPCPLCELMAPGSRRGSCSSQCYDVLGRPGGNACAVWFGDCDDCGRSFTSRLPSKRYCSESCAKRFRKRQRRYLKRADAGDDDVTLLGVAQRDGWRCHLCGLKTNRRYLAGRDGDPTIDHLVPVSAGGSHTWDNVALAHNRCNWERGASGAAQLRLVG